MLEAGIRYYWIEHGTFAGIEKTFLGNKIREKINTTDVKKIRKYCEQYVHCTKKQGNEKVKGKDCDSNQVLLFANTIMTDHVPFKVGEVELSLYELFMLYVTKAYQVSDDPKLRSINADFIGKCVKLLVNAHHINFNSKVNMSFSTTIQCTGESSEIAIKAKAAELIIDLSRVYRKAGSPEYVIQGVLDGSLEIMYTKAAAWGLTINQMLNVLDFNIPDFVSVYDENDINCFRINDRYSLVFEANGKPVVKDNTVIQAARYIQMKEARAFGD